LLSRTRQIRIDKLSRWPDQDYVVAPTSPWGQGAQMFADLVNAPVKAMQGTLKKAKAANRDR